MNVGRSSDREIDRSPAWLSAAFGDGGGEATPFPCHASIDRKRVEGCLDHAEPLRAQRSLVSVLRNEHPEVKLGE